jgi:hypothetical protein
VAAELWPAADKQYLGRKELGNKLNPARRRAA